MVLLNGVPTRNLQLQYVRLHCRFVCIVIYNLPKRDWTKHQESSNLNLTFNIMLYSKVQQLQYIWKMVWGWGAGQGLRRRQIFYSAVPGQISHSASLRCSYTQLFWGENPNQSWSGVCLFLRKVVTSHTLGFALNLFWLKMVIHTHSFVVFKIWWNTLP